jgi:hypothetical protein
VLAAGRLPGGVSSLVAGHRGVVDGQGHGSARRSATWRCGWRGRTPPGDTAGCTAN